MKRNCSNHACRKYEACRAGIAKHDKSCELDGETLEFKIKTLLSITARKILGSL